VQNNVGLLVVNDLLKEKFIVPSYQRGYRWTERQVLELLQDIEDFRNKSERDEFYCLQPIVVKKQPNNVWEVIDGQQRLTTIYIVLTYFNVRLAEQFQKQLYSISYETRPDSALFLKSIDPAKKDDNIDFHFISRALDTVTKWFHDKQNLVNAFEDALLNKVKVIWYEVENDAESIDIFTRINMGKIPLTNAELIKALFLRRGNFDQPLDQVKLKQMQIATEWDGIEYALQDDNFWFFIHDRPAPYDTRIELIFDLIKGKRPTDDQYNTFHKFNEEFGSNVNIDEVWKGIKDYFLTFRDWYQDPILYHMVGYLVTTGTNIAYLKNSAATRNKTDFIEFLKLEIKKTMRVSLDELTWANKQAMRNTLLLFNIQTLLDNHLSYIRFPFDRYKKENWDLEHIRSRQSEIKNNDDRRRWLRAIVECFSGKASEDEIDDAFLNGLEEFERTVITDVVSLLREKIISDDQFGTLYKNLAGMFGEGTDNDGEDDISNLTLLDATTNRSYKNDFFPIKRRKIIGRDSDGTFVPLCTKNVFLKYYSRPPKDLYRWSKKDAADYR